MGNQANTWQPWWIEAIYTTIKSGLSAREQGLRGYYSIYQQINHDHLKANITVMIDEDDIWYHRYLMQ